MIWLRGDYQQSNSHLLCLMMSRMEFQHRYQNLSMYKYLRTLYTIPVFWYSSKVRILPRYSQCVDHTSTDRSTVKVHLRNLIVMILNGSSSQINIQRSPKTMLAPYSATTLTHYAFQFPGCDTPPLPEAPERHPYHKSHLEWHPHLHNDSWGQWFIGSSSFDSRLETFEMLIWLDGAPSNAERRITEVDP
jgi:hypothetical protein